MPYAVTAFAVLATAALAVAAVAGGVAALDVPWAPSWGLRLHLRLDGLGVLYGLLAAGIGAVVFAYATAYVPRHLALEGRRRREQVRFFAWMGTFLVAMVGLATAQDLILLFVFWDLTAVASWALIGFDRGETEARRSALMSLLVTGVSAVLLLIAIFVLRIAFDTTQVPELIERADGGPALALAGALIAVAALAKSAQVPFHFWLPRAMAAPTPVSAYLHSAAMVAAGVLLLSRVHPLLEATGWLLDVLLAVGLTSMLLGGVVAFALDELKQVLAYSTISQYGYIVTMLGIGGKAGAAGASLYVLAHALAKSALFLTAGAVTEATGEKRLSRVGALRHRMPLLAAGSLAAAAGLAALPLTVGFFKDELFFKAALEQGPVIAGLAVAGAALTFAYILRFWGGIFLGRARPGALVDPVERRLIWPVLGLGALVLLGGVFVEPYAALAQDAAQVTAAGPAPVDVAYHLDARTENLMALGAWALGIALLRFRGALAAALAFVARVGSQPEVAYERLLAVLNRTSDRMHDLEVRDLRGRVAAVLVPGGVLVVIGLVSTPIGGTYAAGALRVADVPLALALGIVAVAGIAATRPRRHTALALVLSAVGFGLAVVYTLVGGADVALVAVLIETLFALLFFGVYALVPRAVLRREAELEEAPSRRWRDPLIAVGAGVVAMLVVWGALSRPTPDGGVAERQRALVEEAHGKDVVTVILADFRGLDTLVEITVVAVAVLAVRSLLSARRSVR